MSLFTWRVGTKWVSWAIQLQFRFTFELWSVISESQEIYCTLIFSINISTIIWKSWKLLSLSKFPSVAFLRYLWLTQFTWNWISSICTSWDTAVSASININISIFPLLQAVIGLSEVRIGIVNFPSSHPASYLVFSSVEDKGILNSHSATSDSN